jgi:hypothetical protein
MPAGPVGSVWAAGSWSDTAWEAGSWADAVASAFAAAFHEDDLAMDFYSQCADVTPSDTADGPFPESARYFDALYIGGAGNVVVVGENNKTATFIGVPASRILPVRGKRVNSTNTTATNIVALRKG